MSRFAAAERAALADLLVDIGPDAPTLCTGWSTRDLSAHVVVRERRLDATPGILIKPMAGYTTRVQRQIAGQEWNDLVATVRRPPWWGPANVPVLDEAMNLMEMYVHHEDVRRAQLGWQPRQLSPDLTAALWSRVQAQAKLVLRRTPAEVTVAAPGLGEVTAGRGGPAVRLSGEPQELLLFLFGRQGHARVELTGPDEITSRMRRAHFGV